MCDCHASSTRTANPANDQSAISNLKSTIRNCVILHRLCLPVTSAKHDGAHNRKCRERDHDRQEHSLWSILEMNGQRIGQRQLKQPEHEKINNRRCPGVPSSVERLS